MYMYIYIYVYMYIYIYIRKRIVSAYRARVKNEIVSANTVFVVPTMCSFLVWHGGEGVRD